MTKADLIDEVSRLAELTRKDSEVIVETIFDSVVRSLRVGDKIEIVFALVSGGLAWDAIRRRASASRFPPRRFLSSSPAKS